MNTRKISQSELSPLLMHPRLVPLSDWVESMFDGYYDDPEIVVIDGDVAIDGDLDAAWLEGLGASLSCGILVIDGNLDTRDVVTVHDPLAAIYPDRRDETVALIVRGNLTCRSFFCGDACPTLVVGKATIAEALVARLDHSPLIFTELEAPVALVDQWQLVGDFSGVSVVACETYAGPGSSWPDLDAPASDFFVPEVFSDSGALDTEEVARRLRCGDKVFLSETPIGQPRTSPATSAPNTEDWETAYRSKLAKNPEDWKSTAGLVELLMEREDIDGLRDILNDLPDDSWGRSSGRIERAWLRVFAAGGRNDDELSGDESTQATFERAMNATQAEEWEDAFKLLLHIVRVDRGFRDDLGRIAMVRLFEVVGADSELTDHYRSRLGAAMW